MELGNQLIEHFKCSILATLIAYALTHQGGLPVNEKYPRPNRDRD